MSGLAAASSIVKRKFFFTWAFPFMLVVTLGPSFPLLRAIFTVNTRWLYIIFLAFFLVVTRNFFRSLGLFFSLFLFFYLAWCFLTSFWSQVPLLSVMKSGSLIMVTLTMITAGMMWVKQNAWYDALNYMVLLIWVVVVWSVFKFFHGYDAALMNENMFGSVLFMLLPFVLWRSYQKGIKQWSAMPYIFLLASVIYMLIQSMSRASLLGVVIVFFLFFTGFRLNKKLQVLLFSFLMGVTLMIFYPQAFFQFIALHIYKTSISLDRDKTDLFFSRRASWQESYAGAVAGGWMGVGYGISNHLNYRTEFTGSLTSIGYTREKGNSQLAIVEETGLIGFCFYLFLWATILVKLLKLRWTSLSSAHKVLSSIILGTFLGFTAQSFFEAWWGSPGSPEAIYFWLLVGVLRGLELKWKEERLYALSQIKTSFGDMRAGAT